jgi:5-methylcytosine-specific restriction endonuclease McrA
MTKFFVKAFEESNGRCVYCLNDLLASFEEFSQSQEDHLMPRSCGGPDSADNIVIACAVCNALKHHHAPCTEPYDPEKREEYILKARQRIFSERYRKFEDYDWWIARFTNRFVKK